MATTKPSGRDRRPAPPSTLLLLVRHGTTPSTGKVLPGRAAGLHLAESGTAQANVVAKRLAVWAPPPSAESGRASSPARTQHPAQSQPSGRPTIAAVYTSPLERTKETAVPIAAALGLRSKVERGLIECDFGEWTGAELATLAKKPEWATVQRYPSGFRFPGGESFAGMRARMAETLRSLCSRHENQTVVAVSHADPIKAAVADALGTHLDLFQRIVVSPCSVTAISYGAGGPTVLAVNSTGSLEELRPS